MNWALGERARLDVRIILSASEAQFGEAARRRYRLLLEQAIEDVAENPRRAGVRAAREGMWLYHTRHARNRVQPRQRVARPRHLIVFTIVGDELRILRVLHDAMDLPTHLHDI